MCFPVSHVMNVHPEVTYILVGHVPVRPFSIRHNLPHDNTVTPHVTCRGEFTVLDSFWCSPPDRDFSTLFGKTVSKDFYAFFSYMQKYT